jgi:hypothetical protein
VATNIHLDHFCTLSLENFHCSPSSITTLLSVRVFPQCLSLFFICKHKYFFNRVITKYGIHYLQDMLQDLVLQTFLSNFAPFLEWPLIYSFKVPLLNFSPFTPTHGSLPFNKYMNFHHFNAKHIPYLQISHNLYPLYIVINIHKLPFTIDNLQTFPFLCEFTFLTHLFFGIFPSSSTRFISNTFSRV